MILDEEDLNKRITIERFASLVGVSDRTIYRYINTGKLLPRRTLGGKPYFLIADVQLYRKHNSQEPLILDGAETNGSNE